MSGHTSRVHITNCHNIKAHLLEACRSYRQNQSLFSDTDRTHPIDVVLQKIKLYSLEDTRFKATIDLLLEIVQCRRRSRPPPEDKRHSLFLTRSRS